MVAFASLWSMGAYTAMHSEYAHLQAAYHEGNFSVVEGLATDFQPMPYEGHRNECFTVQNKQFCYSDYGPSAGFNNSTSHGGPIRENLPVRVSYVGNTIVRLEVKSDALVSGEDRTRFSRATEAESQRRMEKDPMTRHMNLGFAIAMVFVSGWWNFGWRRFMKFFRLTESSKPALLTLFRAFLAANFVGSIWNIGRLVMSGDLSRSDYLVGIEVGVGIVGVVWLMVNFTEGMNRRSV